MSTTTIARAAMLAASVALAVGCGAPAATAGGGPSAGTAASSVSLGPVSRHAGCRVRGQLPDHACSPGAIFAGVGVGRICTAGYSRSVRDVPDSLKRAVYAEYGITHHTRGSYEVDHLVPLEVGGSNDIANLWPEASPGYHTKDRLENRLHDAVCTGAIGLRAAQLQIARDWRRVTVP